MNKGISLTSTVTAHTKKEIDKKVKQNGNAIKKYDFFKAYFDNGNFKSVEIKRVPFIELLQSFGFARFQTGGKDIYIQIVNNIVTEVNDKYIIDTVDDYIRAMPENIPLQNGMTFNRIELLEKFFKGVNTFFSESLLDRLRVPEQLVFNSDTVNECFFYFQNGFVCCTATGWEFKTYAELNGLIWKYQIINKEFTYENEFIHTEDETAKPVFQRFLAFICDDQPPRLHSLCSITGYLLHRFMDTKLVAVLLTDSKISDRAEGRTGKNLYTAGIGQMKNLTLVNGRDFDPTQRYKYSLCDLSTEVVHVADLKPKIPFSTFYNDITESFLIEKKGENAFRLQAKLILSTNRTIQIEGSSDKGRCIEFEFSNYFSHQHTPEDEFGHWLFRDWSLSEYNRFHNFMCFCVCSYLKYGILQAKPINLNLRKLQDQTSEEFLDFMTGANFRPIVSGVESTQYQPLSFDEKYNTQTLHSHFISIYPDYLSWKLSQRKFNEWLKTYANYQTGFMPFNDKTDWVKNDKQRCIIFRQRRE